MMTVQEARAAVGNAQWKWRHHQCDAAWQEWRAAQSALDAVMGVDAWGQELPGTPVDFCEVMARIFLDAPVGDDRSGMGPVEHALVDALELAFDDEAKRWERA